jgi:anthranilate synthase component II
MAISHKRLDVKGVQFHPESVMTEAGRQILKNWVCLTPDNKPSSHVVKPK